MRLAMCVLVDHIAVCSIPVSSVFARKQHHYNVHDFKFIMYALDLISRLRPAVTGIVSVEMQVQDVTFGGIRWNLVRMICH